jgi:hypothetical protein
MSDRHSGAGNPACSRYCGARTLENTGCGRRQVPWFHSYSCPPCGPKNTHACSVHTRVNALAPRGGRPLTGAFLGAETEAPRGAKSRLKGDCSQDWLLHKGIAATLTAMKSRCRAGPRGRPQSAGPSAGPSIGVKISRAGHKILETQSTPPTLGSSGRGKELGILTPMAGPRGYPCQPAPQGKVQHG